LNIIKIFRFGESIFVLFLKEFKEIVYLPDLLNIRESELKERQNLFERYMLTFYNSKPSTITKRFVKHKYNKSLLFMR